MNVRVLFILFQVVLLQRLYADLVEEREYEYDNAREDETVDDINDEQSETATESANIQDEISTELDEEIAEITENDDWKHQEQSVGGSILSDFIAKLSDDRTEEMEEIKEENEIKDEEQSPNIVEYTLPQQADTEEQQKTAQDLRDLLETDVIQLSEVKVQILDKASSVCRDQVLRTNEPYQLGDLTVTLKNAFMTAENVVPFSVIGFLDIKKGDTTVFQNWMSGTYKSAVTFDHAIYDIKLTNDKN